MTRFLARFPAAILVLVLWACAVNPATGKRELSLVGEGQEVAMGREARDGVVASLGLVDDARLQEYVAAVGQELAAVSERPELPWSFQVVDDPSVNAFALPGGYIFVTRGILARFASEAELAGVLGHEIGHVTARHSVRQMSRQQLQQLGLGLGMVLSEDLRAYGDLLATGVGLLNLRYSRADETQADELGLRYITRDGYDPQALVGVFQMLATVSGDAGGRAPEWQLTHPYPERREEHIREALGGVATTPRKDDGRDRYLDRVDGIVYGADPREGYFRDRLFLHPELAFQWEIPQGWKGINQKSAVAAVSPDESSAVLLDVVTDSSDPRGALRSFLSQEGVEGGSVDTGDLHGLPAARARFSMTKDGDVAYRGQVVFVRHQGTMYRLLGVSAPASWEDASGPVAASLASFRPLTDRAVLGVEPWRLDVVRVPRAMTLEAFYDRYPSVIPLAEVAALNRLEPTARVEAGTRLKRVVGSPLP